MWLPVVSASTGVASAVPAGMVLGLDPHVPGGLGSSSVATSDPLPGCLLAGTPWAITETVGCDPGVTTSRGFDTEPTSGCSPWSSGRPTSPCEGLNFRFLIRQLLHQLGLVPQILIICLSFLLYPF